MESDSDSDHGRRRQRYGKYRSYRKRSRSHTPPRRFEGRNRGRSQTPLSPCPPPRILNVAESDRRTAPVDERLDHLERLVEKLVSGVAVTETSSASTSTAETKYHLNTDCIPQFVPGNPSLTAKRWLRKIEQLAEINDWSDKTKIFTMQNKLGGLAKNWYNGLSEYNYTWEEWKSLVIRTFPDNQDFASLLRRLINRIKFPGETWEKYYFEKKELLDACEIQGKNAVSCIIDGMNNATLQTGAKAGRYETPEELYASYLSTLAPEVASPRLKREFKHVDKSRRHQKSTKPYKFRCYNCKSTEHMASKCSQPKIQCAKCRLLGHTAEQCNRKSATAKLCHFQGKENHCYFVDCKVNEEPAKGYVDTGCSAVLVTNKLARRLKLKIEPTGVTIRGYSGGRSDALGTCEITLEVDLAVADVQALVVSDTVQEIPIIIGQTFLNSDNVVMVLKGEKMRIFNKHLATLPEVEALPERKINLWARNATVIPPNHVGRVEVTSDDDYQGEVFVDAQVRMKPGQEHYVAGCVTKVRDGVIPIVNTSDHDLEFKALQLLVRGVPCCEDQRVLPEGQVSVLKVQSYRQSFCMSDIEAQVDESLSFDHKRELLKLLNDYRDCFAQNTQELGKASGIEMKIKLIDEEPVTYRPYRLSFAEREKVRHIIADLMDNEIIRESESPYASPILLVKKKNNETRMCVDYRALNAKTVKDKYPIPRLDDYLDKLKGSRYYTSLDMSQGYHQIPISEESIPKTAFVTPDGHYEWLRMPFGLACAPAVFQRTVNRMIRPLYGRNILAYMDDLLLPSESIETGLESLELLLKELRKAKLTLRLSKCYFFRENIQYLGHEINREGIRPGVTKVEAVKGFPTPKNVHEVRQFIGLCSYFRKFIKGFSSIALPLTTLTKKDRTFAWESSQQKAFDELKEKLTTRPVLAIYDPQAETELHTDASKLGISGILLQRQKDTTMRPVMYYSRQTSKEEQRYHSYELETLAVVASMKHYRVYLLGIKFTVLTDCNALRTTLTKRDLIPRIGRWWLLVQEFDFTIQYRAGKGMAHVDALSRNAIIGQEEELEVFLVDITEDDWISVAQMRDERCKYIKEVLSRSPVDAEERSIHKDYQLKDNRVYKKDGNELKWVVPKFARKQVTDYLHKGGGHLGAERTLQAVRRNYWFPKMRKYIKNYTSACLECLYNKESGEKRQGYLHPIPKISTPMDTLHLDHLGPFVPSRRKNTHIIVAVDAFTKFVFLKAVQSTKVGPVLVFLTNIIDTFGVPKRLICDRGTCFTSKRFSEFTRRLGVKVVLTATATPRANGQVERYNRTILSALAASVVEEDKWDLELTRLQWGLNSSINATTGKSAYQLLLGYQPRGPSDSFLSNEVASESPSVGIDDIREEAGKRIIEQQAKQKQLYDLKRCTPQKYKVGQHVLVRKLTSTNDGKSKKLLPKFSGPYVISRVLEHDRYVVEDIEGSNRSQRKYKGVYSVDKLKPYVLLSESDEEGTDESEESLR